MKNINFQYRAQAFLPRAGLTKPVLLFVARAEDIQAWAGVPRKAFDYKHGFQRVLNAGRVHAISDYFKESKENFSPTSIVVAFREHGAQLTRMTSAADRVSDALVDIEIMDYDKMTLAQLIRIAIPLVEQRLAPELVDQIKKHPSDALQEALDLQSEVASAEASDEDFGDGEDDLSEGNDRSYLGSFYAQLRAFDTGELDVSSSDESLREVLYSFVKPAIIVDGQHRVFGAAYKSNDVLFPVCAMTDSTWSESVYQFVVINQKARPIRSQFLSHILANSLSQSEIDRVYARLQTSRIDVGHAAIMDRVNNDPTSPFAGMIDFGVDKSPGFLSYPGMTKLVKDFQRVPRSHRQLIPSGKWPTSVHWIEFFFAFWRGVRNYFEGAQPSLWQEPSETNPNHLLMIVTLQEMQRVMLQIWVDNREKKNEFHKPSKVEANAMTFWNGFPPSFFQDAWPNKGLQTDIGRRLLREALLDTRRNIGVKGWSHKAKLDFFKVQ